VKSTTKKIAIDRLTIDPAVQRVEGLDNIRVNRMVTEFDDGLLGTLIVSERADGRLVVLDGMHRVETCRRRGFTGLVECKVFTEASLADEYALALGYNDSKLVSAITKFNWRVGAGEKEASEIASVLGDHQWRVTQSSVPGSLTAISATERVYRNGGGTVTEGRHPDLLSRVIEVLTVAWEWDNRSVDAALILGVAQLFGRFGASVDDKKLINEMQATRPGVLIGRAKTLRDAQGGSLPAAVAKILVGMHNSKRRKNLLPEWVWVR
jgi:hypothetical protein